MTPDRTKLRLAAHAAREMPSEVVLALLDQLEAAEADRDAANHVIDRLHDDVQGYRNHGRAIAEQLREARAERDALAATIERVTDGWPFRAMDGTGL